MPPRNSVETKTQTAAQGASKLRGAFRALFRNPETKALREQSKTALLYLRKFCFWGSTIYRDSALEMAYRDGRRSVYLEIQRLLNLSDEAILAMDNPGDPEYGEPEAGNYGETNASA